MNKYHITFNTATNNELDVNAKSFALVDSLVTFYDDAGNTVAALHINHVVSIQKV